VATLQVKKKVEVRADEKLKRSVVLKRLIRNKIFGTRIRVNQNSTYLIAKKLYRLKMTNFSRGDKNYSRRQIFESMKITNYFWSMNNFNHFINFKIGRAHV